MRGLRYSIGLFLTVAGTAPLGAQEPAAPTKRTRESSAVANKEKVTGIGGLFFRAKAPKALSQWYLTQLGVNITPTRVKLDPKEYPNGRFARIHDPEGNPIELWEPRTPSAGR
jgi:hypothetical protein